MKLTVIIPAYNEEKAIGACIQSVLDHGKGKVSELIVVDNASTDRTSEIAGSYPGVTVVREPHKGTGHARQTGFEHAHGDIIAYLDADSMIPEDWTDRIEQFFQDPRVVFLSGAYRYHRHESYRYPAWMLDAIWWFSLPAYWAVGYMGNAGNCAMRAEALRKIGGFDRNIAFYGDDTDLAWKMSKVGKALWRLRFYNYSSARRFDKAGIIQTCVTYMLNYWWPVLFHRPFTPGHHFIEAHKTVASEVEERRA